MAGGMNRAGESDSLTARTARGAAAQVDRSQVERNQIDRGQVDRIARLRRRHCWVMGTEPHPGPWPGLVTEWRREDGGWQARVVYVVGATASTVEEWLPAARLRPGSWPD
jgi:hypothetical protein